MEQLFVTIIVLMLGYLYFRKWLNGRYVSKSLRVDGKTVLITGANAGIGKETAEGLAERGARVIMACRDLKKAESVCEMIISKTKNPNVKVMYLDLASFKSIRTFAKQFLEQEPRLDVLINNAGVFGMDRCLTEDGLEMHMGVNHFGHFLLTILLIDRLNESKPSRIVTVSSWGHTFLRFNKDVNSEKSYNRFYAYGQSKLANVLFSFELASRLADSGITSTSLHPGVVHTELGRHLGSFIFVLSRTVCNTFTKLFFRTTESGAQTTLFAAIDFNYQNISGVYFDDCRIASHNPDADDQELRTWLWETSEKVTGVKFPSDAWKVEHSDDSSNNVYKTRNAKLKKDSSMS